MSYEVTKRTFDINLWIFKFSQEYVPTASEKKNAQRIVDALEGHRVLYEPFEAEVKSACTLSVERLRVKAEDWMKDSEVGSNVYSFSQATRDACQRFLTPVQKLDENWRGDIRAMGYEIPFYDHLGQLRAHIGILLTGLVINYGLRIPERLRPLILAE